MSAAVAIECRGLTRSFGSGDTIVQALRGVDLQIHAGQVTLLVGPSGCGKTTLISILSGILRKDGGELRVFGENPESYTERQRTAWRAHNVGFVFQTLNLVPTLSVEHNVALPLILQGMATREAFARARAVLASLELADRAGIKPGKLSGGQQQRVAIARALVHEPRLLVCDEPTSALDAENGHRVMELLVSVGRRSNRALIVVTHDARIYSFADRILRMEDGRIVEDSSLVQQP